MRNGTTKDECGLWKEGQPVSFQACCFAVFLAFLEF